MIITRDDFLFGNIAVKLGFVDRAKIDEALSLQHATAAHTPIGTILLQKGYLTKDQLEQCLEYQRKAIAEALRREATLLMACTNKKCRSRWRVVRSAQNTIVRCKKCNSEMALEPRPQSLHDTERLDPGGK